MAEPFLSEIRLFSFGFPPRGWAHCNGQILPINQNQALFGLLGTTFGGDGRVNFALPNMMGRSPLHAGDRHLLGQSGGEQAHTLTLSGMPAHSHPLKVAASATQLDPSGGVPAASGKPVFAAPPSAGAVDMSKQMVANTGGSQAHQNMSPYLTLNFCIALVGIFPSQN